MSLSFDVLSRLDPAKVPEDCKKMNETLLEVTKKGPQWYEVWYPNDSFYPIKKLILLTQLQDWCGQME